MLGLVALIPCPVFVIYSVCSKIPQGDLFTSSASQSYYHSRNWDFRHRHGIDLVERLTPWLYCGKKDRKSVLYLNSVHDGVGRSGNSLPLLYDADTSLHVAIV